MTEDEKERGVTLGGGDKCEMNDGNEDEDATEAWVSSAVQRERPGRTPSGVTKLLPGERLGWWSAQKFDKRARMRALVKGAVNDTRTRLLLDTGANVSVISEKFAKQLRLRDVQGHGRCMEIQGFTKGTMATERRALVKVTLGWARVYEFELWIMDHGAGVDVVLGTDFMIPAGVRLDLFHATARLPDEVSIPLIKTLSAPDDRGFGPHVNGGPSEDLSVQGREFVEYRVQRRQPHLDTHEVWVRRTKTLLPTVTKFRRGRVERVRLTNVSDRLTTCHAHTPVLLWVPIGDLPRNDGYVRLDSPRYEDWQKLAFNGSRDETVFAHECEAYSRWLAVQPPAVERPTYPSPTGVMVRPADDSSDRRLRLSCAERWERELAKREEREQLAADGSPVGDDPAALPPQPVELEHARTDVSSGATEESAHRGDTDDSDEAEECSESSLDSDGTLGSDDNGGDDGESEHSYQGEGSVGANDPMLVLERTYVSVATTLTAEEDDSAASEHQANDINLEDYAHELAFLPDLTEASVTELDYSAANVRHPDLSCGRQDRVVKVLRKHENILISSGNALPPPAYGVVCDIDVQGHAPIKQRARRIPLRHLKKLYELLRGLLKAGLIAFSSSPWSSPIVIVLKKNGVDIRLCIDYKMVNAITAIMEYAMPLVDDLLTDLEKYLWYCSLDAASGFWAIMMTQRARQISAFVCALGHFEWLRMPFGLKNAPMIYQRMLDNALWGFVQPKGGWSHFATLMEQAEAHDQESTRDQTEPSVAPKSRTEPSPTKFEAGLGVGRVGNAVSELINSPLADMFADGEPDRSSLVPVFERRSFVDDICFGGESFDSCLATLDRLLARFEECRISVSFTKSIFVQPRVDFLSHVVTRNGIQADPKKLKALTELSFPRSKKGVQAFLGSLNYYSRFIQDFAVYGAALYQLKDEDFSAGSDLSAARRSFAALQQKVADAPILRHFARDRAVHVMLFANEWALSTTLMQEHDGVMHPVRFCGRVLKDAEMNYHPAEKEVLALLQLLKVCYTQLAGRTIHVYTRFSTLEWVHKSKSLFGRATQFAVLLSPWHLVVTRVKEKDCAFAQLLQASITSFVELEDSLAPVTPPTRGSPSVRMDPHLLYARLPRDYCGYVLSFDGSAKTEKHGGYGSCAWILWKLPEWTIVIAASAYLEATTVNLAEYSGMNNGMTAALATRAEELVIVGDSRLAIQQSLGVIACRKETLMAQLSRHKELRSRFRSVKYLHVVREFNAAADSLASETLEKKVSVTVNDKTRMEELAQLNRIQEVIYEPPTETSPPDETSSAERSKEEPARVVSSIRVLDASDTTRRKNFFDFVREPPYVSVVTRRQARERERRVRFADEEQVVDQGDCSPDADPDRDDEAEPSDQPTQPSPDATVVHEPSAEDIDPVVVQEERRRRIGAAQDEELRWSNLKTVLKGEEARLGYKAAREAWKMSDKFVLSEDGLLYFLGSSRRPDRDRPEESTLRLVVPTTMVQEVLQSCHDSLEGGHQGITRTYHRVKADYYWIGLFADVERHVRSCPDCSSSKSRPQLRGYSPGNILAERPLQIVSMDFVIPLPRTRRGNTALLLFQCAFTGFVMGKAMADTSALCVAQAFEECVYRRFGAPTLIRHDRDPRFMGEVFQAFTEMMQSRSRATLSYRPQANGQQERSVKTVIQSVRVYAEDPLQQDWDEIVEKLIFAINNSQDATRKDTPFYLVHGWDARTTLRAMSSSLKRGRGRQTDALAWRREVNRQQEIALEMAKEYQATEKAKRAEKHNETLSRRERESLPTSDRTEPSGEDTETTDPTDGSSAETSKSLFEPGDRAWLYMERVKPGLTKKLAHRWHGPFRIKKKVDEYAYELALPDRSGYRFYPVVHVSRLKKVNEFGDRPKTRLVTDVTDETRLDFDEELLPEDSFEPDHLTGEYEVEAILDDRTPLSTGTERAVREFQVKWVGYDEPTWEPASNLSCGGMLYDYLRAKRSDCRLQMVQVADED